MRRQHAWRAVQSGVMAALVIALAGCGGGGSGTAASGLGPVIADLVARFLAQACSTAQAQDGTVLSLSLSYADPDGDLPAGRLATTGTFAPSGLMGDLVFEFGTGAATVTGTTAGTITAQTCVRFGTDTDFTIMVIAIDGANNHSNGLSAHVTKPAGAPQARRGS